MTDAGTIVITRLFDAPRALVFECWQRHGWSAMLDNLNTYLERKRA